MTEITRDLEVHMTPIKMILHCPWCGAKHVDRPDPEKGWSNPPHRSHLCARCDLVWRPADVPTEGVERIETRGEHDTPIETGTSTSAIAENDPVTLKRLLTRANAIITDQRNTMTEWMRQREDVARTLDEVREGLARTERERDEALAQVTNLLERAR